ncbi:MAG: phosphate acyltransferase PlsX [Inquilinus limosus]|uniref:Phosphate acyltransferase n=1 Tax=Inquilinus limosus TaxID=171674 RepID=A0A952KJQ1_9PROT|nr:phosphate acyltransferase PlsX [Inquilinus limosus]
MSDPAASGPVTIALDAMGGDRAPEMVLEGAEIARTHHPDVHFLIVGDEARIAPLLAKRPALAAVSTIRHAADVITNEDKPSAALRGGRNSSMRLAIDAVAAGEAQGVVSAGNTGALMATAKIVFKTLPGIDRPAIASFFPTLRGESVMLDLGANIECDAENLVQFAIMGSVFAKAVLGLVDPTVGLLNVGSEALKGPDAVRDAAARLRELDFPGRFEGFVEGDDIPAGKVDVVVTDGFSGNIALKTAEGTAKLYATWLRHTFRSSWLASLGYLLARGAFRQLRHRTDPRQYNGALFLGLNGICVKSHGGTDGEGFAHAIDVGVDLVIHGFNDKVKQEFSRFEGSRNGDDAASTGPTTASIGIEQPQ